MSKTKRNLIIATAFLIPVLLTYLVFIPFLFLYAVMSVAWLGGWPGWFLVIIIPAGAIFLCFLPEITMRKRGIYLWNPFATFFASLALNLMPLIIYVFAASTFFN